MDIDFEDNSYGISLTMTADGDDDTLILRTLYYKIIDGNDPICLLKIGLDNVGDEIYE